jgi:hypothetical protein
MTTARRTASQQPLVKLQCAIGSSKKYLLLDYPISDFRVHTVIKSGPSRIPADKEVIVIDVGDSAAAPHQNKRDRIYYRREGGRSARAPHFYLEILRQRLTNPVLEFKLKKIEDADVYPPFSMWVHLRLLLDRNAWSFSTSRLAAHFERLFLPKANGHRMIFDAVLFS